MFGVIFWFCIFLIVYIYVGYPLALALLARVKPARSPAAAQILPSVTLIIAAYNEERVIAHKIENSLALDYPRDRLQILVTCDGSDDRTAEIVRGYAPQGVELVHHPIRRGKTAALNHALPFAQGEIIVFSDANNTYSPNALGELVAPFADPQVGGVSGAKVIERDGSAVGESEGLYWKYESLIKKLETRLGSCTGVAGEIFAIRRDLVEPAPANIINDDLYMALRLVQRGYRVVYAPRARSSEQASLSAQDEVARRARIVAGRYQAIALAPRLLPLRQPLVVWQVVSHKFLRPLVPFAMAGAFVANVLALVFPSKWAAELWTLTSPWGWLFLMAQCTFYGLAFVGGKIKRKGRLERLFYLPTFLVNSNLAAVIGLYRFMTRRQTTLWERVRRA